MNRCCCGCFRSKWMLRVKLFRISCYVYWVSVVRLDCFTCELFGVTEPEAKAACGYILFLHFAKNTHTQTFRLTWCVVKATNKSHHHHHYHKLAGEATNQQHLLLVAASDRANHGCSGKIADRRTFAHPARARFFRVLLQNFVTVYIYKANTLLTHIITLCQTLGLPDVKTLFLERIL